MEKEAIFDETPVVVVRHTLSDQSELGGAVVRLRLGGMDCAGCLKYVTLAVDRLPDVRIMAMDYASGSATLAGTFGEGASWLVSYDITNT